MFSFSTKIDHSTDLLNKDRILSAELFISIVSQTSNRYKTLVITESFQMFTGCLEAGQN